jgi:hypothetical protein
MKFKVEVNPFKKQAIIKTRIGGFDFTKEIYYKELDEWNSFQVIGERVFDIHFHYDEEFTVSIYLVNEGSLLRHTPCIVELSIKLSEPQKELTAVNYLVEDLFDEYEMICNEEHIESAQMLFKKQIVDAYITGWNAKLEHLPLKAEKYYNETFK